LYEICLVPELIGILSRQYEEKVPNGSKQTAQVSDSWSCIAAVARVKF